jgi:hypothetical protein
LPDSVVTDEHERDEWRTRKVTDWLFVLLRFAITRDENDRTAACAAARELDSLGAHPRLSGQGFFARTSADICKAVVEPDNPRSFILLRTHAQRIEHARLRHCFRTAVDLADIARAAGDRSANRSARVNLWAGLRDSYATAPLRK